MDFAGDRNINNVNSVYHNNIIFLLEFKTKVKTK